MKFGSPPVPRSHLRRFRRSRARSRHPRVLFWALAALLAGACSPRTRSPASAAAGTSGVVVSSHPDASEIGLSVLVSGGNAVDAAVAAGLAVGVVDPFNSGIGGGAFLVVRRSDGTVFTVDGRETAPAAATRDMYVENGEVVSGRSREGPLAVGTPGLLAAYVKALDLAGSRPLAELIDPSIRLAETGRILDAYEYDRYLRSLDALRRDPAAARVYLAPDGSPWNQGDRLRQPDLASTYRKIARGGTEYFYRGEFAHRLASYMEANQGLLSLEDMEGYQAVVRPPITGSYRGNRVCAMPLPSSGGILLVGMLNMLEVSGILEGRTGWDAASLDTLSRFLARAFADRAALLGDSDHHPVPVERLLSRTYAESCVREALATPRAGTARPAPAEAPPGGHTTNIATVDRWGNAVCINQTINLSYGARIIVPGTGVLLNNEMDDFSARPGVPNAFGLVGGEANAVAPGKRPLSSMCPVVVVRDHRPVLVLGGAGGPMIISAVLLTLVDVVDFHRSLPEALRAPRFHHQYLPDTLFVEPGTPFLWRLGLRARGRQISRRDPIGIVNAIAWDPSLGAYLGAADPRGRGAARAY